MNIRAFNEKYFVNLHLNEERVVATATTTMPDSPANGLEDVSSDSLESCLNKQLEKIEQEEEKCEGGGKSAEKVKSSDGSLGEISLEPVSWDVDDDVSTHDSVVSSKLNSYSKNTQGKGDKQKELMHLKEGLRELDQILATFHQLNDVHLKEKGKTGNKHTIFYH